MRTCDSCQTSSDSFNYLDELDAKSLTAQMDAALDLIGETDESTELAVSAGRRVLGATDEW